MIVDIPAQPVALEIQWRLRQPTQVNRSEFTGRRRVTILSAAPRWSAQVTMPPIQGEDNILPWRAFFVRLQGKAHSFRLIACERDQTSAGPITVKGGGQAGSSILTQGWGVAGEKLKAGHFATINDQLLQLTAPVVANGAGEATLSFGPYIRFNPANAAPVEVRRPYALMSLSDEEAGWIAGKGQAYTVNFACEESF
ncbi:hypothetical protein [Sphingobium sp.]|uniref:hypothetical protein n=1 Tax=Sphingobium sp. TaxID=1912891 RepID=UPI003BB638BF